MSDSNKTTLREELRKWDVRIQPDPNTTQHVLNRIASEQFEGNRQRQSSKLIPYLLATGIAAILVIGTVFVVNQRAQTRLLQDHQYLSLIDPVTRATLHEESLSSDKLLDQLSWMQDRLDLSRDQFMQLVTLHQNYSEKFNGLYNALIELEYEYDRFEQLRMNNEMVDFIALYDVLTERKETESQANNLSQELISRVSSLLNPSQRTAYLSMVSPNPRSNA